MRFIGFLLFLLIVAYGSWPYLRMYQLDHALNSSDQTRLTELVDIELVRKNGSDSIRSCEQTLKRFLKAQSNLLPDFLRDKADSIGEIGELLGQVASQINKSQIDIDWVGERLRNIGGDSFYNSVSFAFFESPTRFTIRVGELGRSPLFIQMTLQDWMWRVTAIYE